MKKTIYIASDHGGFDLKKTVISFLQNLKYTVQDAGTSDNSSVDFPDFAQKICKHIQKEKHALGILICGTGIGMSIAANKMKGIYAALCCHSYMAKMAKQHNNANILCLGGRVLGDELAKEIVLTFLNTEFLGGKYQKRIEQIDKLYK